MPKKEKERGKVERSEAQKRAQKKYYQTKLKARQKTISITLTPEQAEKDRERIKAAGYSVGQFWRASVDALPPAPNATTDENTTPNA